MRIIKFRCWYSGRMVDVGIMEFFTDGQIRVDEELVVRTENLMQFTCMLDKNGKEIYEGDILRVDERETSIGQVIFDDAEFKLKMVLFKGVLWKLGSKIRIKKQGLEVIGNIYEDSELLK